MTKTTKAVAMLGVVAGLGLAALPLSTYAVDDLTAKTGTSEVSLTIDGTLQISADATATLAKGSDGDANYVSSGFKVKVTTNNSNGYTISIKDTDSDTSLKSGSTNEIEAKDGLSNGNKSAWGYKVNAGAGVSTQSSWTAVTDDNVVIYTGTQTQGGIDADSGIDTEVIFGAKVVASQAAGTYTDNVTFTATAL